jgi:hypothetical protein
MTHQHDIELVLDEWFSDGPTQMPSRFLTDTLDRIDHSPPRRFATPGAGWRSAVRGLRLATAAAVVLALAGIGTWILLRTDGLQPAGSGALPASLQAEWHPVGTRQHQMISGSVALDLDIVIGPNRITTFQFHGDLIDSASLLEGNRFVLRTISSGTVHADGTDLHCQIGDEATYTFRLSDADRILTLTPVNDACAERAAILAGDWTRTDLGPQQAGRHEATVFRLFAYGTAGRLAYTVPAGWVGTSMNSGQFWLVRPGDSGSAGLRLISNAYASDQDAPCNLNQGAGGIGQTPQELADWLTTLPGLVVSAPTEVSIGGLSGIMVDLSMAADWTPTCDSGIYTFSLSSPEGGDWSDRLRIAGTGKQRYILLDRGDGSSLVIDIEAPAAGWDAFLTEVQPVIDGLEFTR